MEEEEDLLNKEFGTICSDISSLQQTSDNISHEIVSLTALLETSNSGNTWYVLFAKNLIGKLEKSALIIGSWNQLVSFTEAQTKEVQASKEQAQSKLQNCRDKILVLKAKQSELSKKIREVGAEIASKSEIVSVSWANFLSLCDPEKLQNFSFCVLVSSETN